MIEFHRIWTDQCEAARDIREAFGLEKALGYLIGEKFLTFLETSDREPEFAAELPRFVEEIKQIFVPQEIDAYLARVHRVGALGHVCSDEAYEEMREAGVVSRGSRRVGAAGPARRTDEGAAPDLDRCVVGWMWRTPSTAP